MADMSGTNLRVHVCDLSQLLLVKYADLRYRHIPSRLPPANNAHLVHRQELCTTLGAPAKKSSTE